VHGAVWCAPVSERPPGGPPKPLLPYAFFDIDLEVCSNGIASLASHPKRDVEGRCRIQGHGEFPVRLHLKGRATFESISERPSLTVKGVPRGAVPGEVFAGKFYLHNSNQDDSLLRDMISRAIFSEAGVPAPAIAYARLRLNGRLLGQYTVCEGVSRRFLERSFGCKEGRLWEGEQRECDESFTNALGIVLHGWEARAYDPEHLAAFIAADYLANQGDGFTCARNNYWVYLPSGADRLRLFPHTMDYGFRGPAASLCVFAQAAREFLGDEAGRHQVRIVIREHCAPARRQRVLATLENHGLALIEDIAKRDAASVHARCKAFERLSVLLTNHYEDLQGALEVEAGRQDCSMSFTNARRWQGQPDTRWSSIEVFQPKGAVVAARVKPVPGAKAAPALECLVLAREGRWQFQAWVQCVPSSRRQADGVVWLGAGGARDSTARTPCDLSGEWREVSHEFVVDRPSSRQLFSVQAVRLRVASTNWQGRIQVDTSRATLRRIGD
jgi:hypothetical protein